MIKQITAKCTSTGKIKRCDNLAPQLAELINGEFSWEDLLKVSREGITVEKILIYVGEPVILKIYKKQGGNYGDVGVFLNHCGKFIINGNLSHSLRDRG